jgi:hypothetical protein
VVVEPGERFFRIFRRGAVFHSNELFSDAHFMFMYSSASVA